MSNMADGLGFNPRAKEPESALVPGMAAGTPQKAAGKVSRPGLLSMPDTSGPPPVPLQEPGRWIYDFNPASGSARATFNGEVSFSGTAPGVTAFNGRTGNVSLTPTDVAGAGSVTPAPGDNSTAIATTAFVTTANAANVKSVKIQKFTAAGAFTYTPSAGMIGCIVEAVGGGGGSGGATGAASAIIGGGGGGGGAYSRKSLTAAQVGASLTGTIGAGGAAATAGSDTTLSSFVTAKGGSGGTAAAGATFGYGGAGGPAASSIGDFTIQGNYGLNGEFWNTAAGNHYASGGVGGASFLGAWTVANPASGTTSTAGAAGTSYGGGAAGACANNVAASQPGAAGAAGAVIVTEFCSQ